MNPGCFVIPEQEMMRSDRPQMPIDRAGDSERALSTGTRGPAARPVGGINSGQREFSCGGDNPQSALAVGGEGQAGADVFHRQVGKISKNFLGRHAGGQIFQYIPNRHPQSTNTRLTPSLAGFNGNQVGVIHMNTVFLSKSIVNVAKAHRSVVRFGRPERKRQVAFSLGV